VANVVVIAKKVDHWYYCRNYTPDWNGKPTNPANGF